MLASQLCSKVPHDSSAAIEVGGQRRVHIYPSTTISLGLGVFFSLFFKYLAPLYAQIWHSKAFSVEDRISVEFQIWWEESSVQELL